MTGVSLTVESADLVRLERRLAQITNGTLLRGALSDIADYGESSTRRRLSDEKRAPDGSAWPAWSDDYAKTREPQHSLLENRGDLIDSITSDSDADSALWGSNLIYAATHQLGDDNRNIPARAYLGLSEDDIDAILDLVEARVDRTLQ